MCVVDVYQTGNRKEVNVSLLKQQQNVDLKKTVVAYLS